MLSSSKESKTGKDEDINTHMEVKLVLHKSVIICVYPWLK